MADSETVPQIKILKNSKILVNVEEVIQDILVVSYAIESKLYEGVLLDSTKKSLPCGSVAAASLAGLYSVAAATAAGSPRDGDEDRLYSVGQRFSYCGVVAGAGAGSGAQGGAGAAAPFHLRRAVRPPARYKTSRMTVRLRPRQVLCSKCRSICNENSENVDLSAAGAGGRRRGSARLAGAGAGGGPGAPPGAGGGGDPGAEDPAAAVVETRRPSPRPLFSENQRDNQPRVCGGAGGRMVLRKKRSVGSMEDLWDESVFEAEAKRARAAPSPTFALGPAPPATPVIKISFGRQGEGGTVLKIPSRARSLSVGGAIGGLGLMGGGGGGGAGGGGGSSPAGPGDDASASAKAAKKALKKAKREARRKLLGAGVPGPNSSPAYDALYPRRRKHKVKHKKKHRDERRHAREGSVEVVEVAAAAAAAAAVAAGAGADVHECPDAASVVGGAVGGGGDSYSAIKERCLKQKLSISLKRLNANAYMRCDAAAAAAAAVAVAAAAGGGGGGGSSPSAHAHGHAHSPSRSSSCSNSEEESLAVPDFPAPAAPAPLLLPAVASCLTADGRRMAVGDVVWGKIHGFPWWPGKVLSITLAHKEDGGAPTPQAHVAWYGSSTSSLMPCDQLSPFLETFKARYNKKKRGPYKEAIRQATSEARRDRHLPVDGTVSMAASPREVNVAS